MPIPRYDTREERLAADRRNAKLRGLGRPALVLPHERDEALKMIRLARERGGMPDEVIAQQVGLHGGGIYKIRTGGTKGMYRSTYERIMTLRPAVIASRHSETRHRLPAGTHRDPTGTRRRLQALRVEGFPGPALGRFLGCTGTAVSNLTRGVSDKVFQSTHLDVKELYEKLAGTDPLDHGVSRQGKGYSINWARKYGYAPSHCWDDDTIDDPDAFPDWTGACGTIHGRTVHERESIPVCQACRDARRDRNVEPDGRTFDGAKLCRLMDREDMTIEGLGALMGLHKTTVWGWRVGRFRPSLERTERLAEIFGIHPSELEAV